ncbi:MAG: hypothetical protein ACREIU_03840, partial [Planctomycetota bacterium]
MNAAILVAAAIERWRPGDPPPDSGPSLPEERRRKLAPADALATRAGIEIARRAGFVLPLAPPRRLAILLAADGGPRAARTEFLAGPPPAGLA